MPKKYVDLDEALELFDADMNFRNWNGEVIGKLAHISAFQKVAREKLLSLPLADVVERKKGFWEWVDDMDYRCSVCHKYAYGCLGEVLSGQYKYCPYCGSAMEGEEDDE